MKNKNLVVQRVPDYYVFEEYAQIRIPFMSSIKIHDNSFFMASNMICSYNLKLHIFLFYIILIYY